MTESRRSKDLDVNYAILNIRENSGRDALGTAAGMSPTRQQEVQDTYAVGIRNGTVRFVPRLDEEGVFGELHITADRKGKKQDKIRKIRDSAQAGYLIGLQGEVDSKRK